MNAVLGAMDDVAEGAGEGAESIVLAEVGAIGCGAAKNVADVVVEVVGGDESAARGFMFACAGAGDVADWKSSKSSSAPAVLLSSAPKSFIGFEAAALELPFVDLEAGMGSSPKSNRSCSGAFCFGGADWVVFLT